LAFDRRNKKKNTATTTHHDHHDALLVVVSMDGPSTLFARRLFFHSLNRSL
jgi:hypothetical protein